VAVQERIIVDFAIEVCDYYCDPRCSIQEIRALRVKITQNIADIGMAAHSRLNIREEISPLLMELRVVEATFRDLNTRIIRIWALHKMLSERRWELSIVGKDPRNRLRIINSTFFHPHTQCVGEERVDECSICYEPYDKDQHVPVKITGLPL
jgi:hypothetical protein